MKASLTKEFGLEGVPIRLRIRDLESRKIREKSINPDNFDKLLKKIVKKSYKRVKLAEEKLDELNKIASK